jgi:hypothetical protein
MKIEAWKIPGLVNVYIKLWKIIGKWWFYGKNIGKP